MAMVMAMATGTRQTPNDGGRRGDDAHGRSAMLKYVKPLLVGVLALGTAYFAFADAVGGITRARNPEFALRWVPNDPIALTNLADLKLAASPRQLEFAKRLAHRSIEGLALNPRALRVLGLVSDTRGRKREAARQMLMSARISRRETATQIWLIERSVERNDLVAALRHYNIALSSSSTYRPLLFPILLQAMDDPAIQKNMSPYVKEPAPWLFEFLIYALNSGTNPKGLASMIVSSGRLPAGSEYRAAESQILLQLAETGNHGTLKQFYRSLNGADPSILRTSRFDDASTSPRFSPITWQFTQAAGLGAVVEKTENGAYGLRVFAGSGEQGVAARKLLALEPGSYSLESHHGAMRGGEGARAVWAVGCLRSGGGTPIGEGSNLVTSKAADRMTFSVTQECELVSLDLLVAGGADQEGAEFIVNSVTIKKVS